MSVQIKGSGTIGGIDEGLNITGVITATSFVGDGSGLTGAGPSLTGSTNNTVVTVTGSNAVQGEANLTFDGSILTVTGNVDLPDNTSGNASLRLGNSQDLLVNHNGTDSFIINNTGDLYVRDLNGDVHIQGKDAEEGIIVKADGAVELYYDNSKKIETSSTGVSITGNATISGAINTSDNQNINVGNGGDLKLYHDGSNSYILNSTNNLIIKDLTDAVYIQAPQIVFNDETTNENIARFISDGACELYHDNSKKLNTNSGGVDITGHAYFPDNNGTHFGAGEDFKIYHDGTSNIFQSNGLKNFIFRPKDTDVGLKIIGDGGVELYYDNGVRLQTTTNGVTAGTPDTSQTAVVGAQAGFFGGAKSLFASATGLIQNQVCILDTATSAAAGTGGALTFAGYIDNDSTTYYATIEGVKANSSTNNYDGNLKFLTRAHNVANMNEAMIIDSSGNVMINQTTALAKLTVAATWSQAPISCDTTSSNASAAQINFRFNNSAVGNIVSTSSNTAYNTSSSDRALKKNFEDWNENTLDLFKSLKPQKFHFLTDEDSDPKSKGYIAQDLVDSFPEAYPLNPQTDKYDFNPSGMVTYLMKALQEEIVKREALEARIDALEG